MATKSHAMYPAVRIKVNQARPKPASCYIVSHACQPLTQQGGTTHITTTELSSSISRQDQDNQGHHKLRDPQDKVPSRLGRDVCAIMSILATSPGIIGESSHVVGDQ